MKQSETAGARAEEANHAGEYTAVGPTDVRGPASVVK